MRWVLVGSILFLAIVASCAAGSADPPVGLPVTGGDAATEDQASGKAATPADGASQDASATADGPPPDATTIADTSPDDATSADATMLDGNAEVFDAPPDDGPLDATATDLARSAIAYTWQSMTSATADTGKMAAPALNDGSLTTQVNIDSSAGDKANAWEGAGVIFASAQTVASAAFVQGTTGTASAGDGWFEANFGLQFSSDGTTWTAVGWNASPPYAYSSAVSGKKFSFSGPAVTGVRGVRVVGQVNTVGQSWWAAANEILVFGP
jgi:hypothetical protein